MPFSNERSPSAPIIYGGVSINPAEGSVSADVINADTLNLGGTSITDTLMDLQSSLPAGVIWRQKLIGTMRATKASYVTVFKRNITLVGGRNYHVNVSPIELTIASTSVGSGMFGYLVIIPRRSEPTYFLAQHYLYTADRSTRNTTLIEGALVPIQIPEDSGINQGSIEFRVYGPTDGGQWLIRTQYNFPEIQVIDNGAYANAAFGDTDLSTIVPDIPDVPPAPTPTTTTYTGDWYTSHYATYSINSGANQTSDYPGLIRQSTAVTPRIGMTRFASTNQHGHSLATLRGSNVSIKSVIVYMGAAYDGKVTRWYYSAGGTGRLYYHNASSFPAQGIPGRTFLGEIPNWANNQEKSYNGGSTIANAIKNNTFQGFALSGEGRTNQYTYHGEFPYRMRLRISYTITE